MEVIEEKKYKIRTNKNNEMNLFIKNINNEELSITLFTINKYPSKKYELKCNLEEFQKNRFFKIFINVEEIMKELENKIEKSTFIEETNLIIIDIQIGLTIINEILLVIEEKEKNKDEIINELIEKNKELEKKINELNNIIVEKDKLIKQSEQIRNINEEEDIKKSFNDKYQIIKLLNNDSFNDIFEVKEKLNENKHYALKIFKKELKLEYKKEIEIMKNIKSKYIIELKDYFYDEENEGYYILTELYDGNLRDILNKYKPKGLSLNIIIKIFIQLNDALKAMRDQNYTHRDLKPENILIKYTDNKNNFDIKLTGFFASTNEIHSNISEHSMVGTSNYMAPEIDDFKYNNKCDLWSLGVILYELYTNKYIFYSNNRKEREINKYEGKIVKETDNKMINKLIRKLIQVDINKRIKWEEYFNDDLFKNNNEKNIIENKKLKK